MILGFLLVAIPVILAAMVWVGWTMWQLVFSDDFAQGVTEAEAPVPVRLVDIVERQRRWPARPEMPSRQRVAAEAEAVEDALAEDLWKRRN